MEKDALQWRLADVGQLQATLIAIGSHGPPRQFAGIDRLIDCID